MKPTTMLELQKLVLENVYQNAIIFEKELYKSFKWLGTDDLRKLYKWAIAKFDKRNRKIVNRVYLSFEFQS